MISAQPLDLGHESAGPSRLTLPVRPSRARLEPLLRSVERGPARPDGAGRLLGREPARAGEPPAVERVSPEGRGLGGLGRQPRRQPGAAIDWRLKAKNLHRGSPETGVSKHELQRSPIRFKGRADPSHIYLNSDKASRPLPAGRYSPTQTLIPQA